MAETTAQWEQKHTWAASAFALLLVVLVAWFFMS